MGKPPLGVQFDRVALAHGGTNGRTGSEAADANIRPSGHRLSRPEEGAEETRRGHVCRKIDTFGRHSIKLGARMWFIILGTIAALLVLIAVLVMVSIRALRKFVRSVWPHS